MFSTARRQETTPPPHNAFAQLSKLNETISLSLSCPNIMMMTKTRARNVYKEHDINIVVFFCPPAPQPKNE